MLPLIFPNYSVKFSLIFSPADSKVISVKLQFRILIEIVNLCKTGIFIISSFKNDISNISVPHLFLFYTSMKFGNYLLTKSYNFIYLWLFWFWYLFWLNPKLFKNSSIKFGDYLIKSYAFIYFDFLVLMLLS